LHIRSFKATNVNLGGLARRWLDLDAEIKAHAAHLEALVERCAPTLVKAYGIKAGTAAEMLVLVGDNLDRIRSKGALAKLCGACPIPASSGKVTRYRLNRGGNRQANAALHRVVIVHMFTKPTGIFINPATCASTIAGTLRGRRQAPPHGVGPVVGV
jgi:transposase